MTLPERITQDLKTAMKAKDKVALRSIRAIKAELLLKKTDGSQSEINESESIGIIQKLIKQRQDSLKIYETQNREDLAEIERQEIEVLARYLPKQLSSEELQTILRKIISDNDASSIKDMGRIMGIARQKIAGRADNKLIAATVKELLS